MPSSTATSPRRRIATTKTGVTSYYRYYFWDYHHRVSQKKGKQTHTRFNRKHDICRSACVLANTTGRVELHLNEGVLRRAGEPLASGVPMQWLPRERGHPLLVRRKGLTLLLPFRGIPQPYFTLLVRGRETLSFATKKQGKSSQRPVNATIGSRIVRNCGGQGRRHVQKSRYIYRGQLTGDDVARLTVWRPRSAKDMVPVSSASELRERCVNVPKPGTVRRRREGR